jgi:hypothetical protein
VIDALQPLRDWLRAHPDPGERVAELRGGDAVVQPDGTRAVTFPHFAYSRAIDDFWTALDDVPGWSPEATGDYLAVTARWRERDGAGALDTAAFARMDRATLLHFLRWIDRGERFCDGHWASCFEQGFLHAAARALIAIGPVPPNAGVRTGAGRRRSPS